MHWIFSQLFRGGRVPSSISQWKTCSVCSVSHSREKLLLVWHVPILTVAGEPHGWRPVVSLGIFLVAVCITCGRMWEPLSACSYDDVLQMLSAGKIHVCDTNCTQNVRFTALQFCPFYLTINYTHLCAFNFIFHSGRQQRVLLMDCTITLVNFGLPLKRPWSASSLSAWRPSDIAECLWISSFINSLIFASINSSAPVALLIIHLIYQPLILFLTLLSLLSPMASAFHGPLQAKVRE